MMSFYFSQCQYIEHWTNSYEIKEDHETGSNQDLLS